MNAQIPKALLVDDTSMFRTLAKHRLESAGVHCDEAATCDEAERLLNQHEYAILVTELHLPGRHAYHMVIDLLRRAIRPLVVVATDIRELRLAQHLFDAGAEEVLFKPVDYGLLAAKLKVRAAQWQQQWSPMHQRSAPAARSNESRRDAEFVSAEELQTKLQHLTGMLPLSTTAFDVFNATRDDRFDAKEIERVIAKESSLAVELLRLANSMSYNASSERVTSLTDAIVRVGRRKIGELALAHTAKASLTQRVVPWLDVDLLWRRSMAASAAAEFLETQNRSNPCEGIVLAALMHGLGRVVLASLYPQLYEGLLSECEDTRESLDDLEERCFPLSTGQVMARVLELWHLPETVWRPLDPADVADAQSIGRRLESALALGNLATGSWQDFDRVTLPEFNGALTSQGLESLLAQVVEGQASARESTSRQVDAKRRPRIRYARANPTPPDLPGLLVKSFATVDSISLDGLDQAERAVIDCRDAAPYSLAPFVSQRTFDPRQTIIANREDAGEFRRFGHVISFPLSYAALRHACLGATVQRPAEPAVIHAAPFQSPIAAAFDTRL